ncbi:MAG: PaaI family thioesterase [Desulfuromonadaceae bacterium]
MSVVEELRQIRPVGSAQSLAEHYGHGRCVICGDHNPHSLKLFFEPTEDDGVRASFTAHGTLQGYAELLHGGVSASLLDAAMTHCLFHLGIEAVTGELHIRYLHPIPCGSQLEIRAWRLSSYPPLHCLKAQILSAGKIMTLAEAKFMERPVP